MDRYGIITAHLTDPLSLLIDKIINSNAPNSIGFYYKENEKYYITLFNTYDNNYPIWVDPNYSLDLLSSSSFVDKITLYPIIDEMAFQTSFVPFYKNNNPFRSNSIISGPKLRFIQKIISSNINIDRKITYNSLFLKKSITTGYDLINDFIEGKGNISPNMISSSLLRDPIVVHLTDSDQDNEVIIEKCKSEITKLVEVFIDLYLSNKEFQNNILSNHYPIPLNDLFSVESDLVSHIVGGLKNGFISNGTLNYIIENLNVERKNLSGNPLPLSITPNKNIKIITEVIACTFGETYCQNFNYLQDLGCQLNNLVNSKDLVINVGDIIATYNNISENKITVNNEKTISKEVTLVVPCEENININKDEISVHSENLNSIRNDQLIDILIYIDSLRDGNGINDIRFVDLENKIVRELARRRETQNHK